MKYKPSKKSTNIDGTVRLLGVHTCLYVKDNATVK